MKRKTKIIITFTENNLPKAKVRNATGAQVMQAAMMLNRYSRVADKKKQNKLARFIKRFVAYYRTKNTKSLFVKLDEAEFLRVSDACNCHRLAATHGAEQALR